MSLATGPAPVPLCTPACALRNHVPEVADPHAGSSQAALAFCFVTANHSLACWAGASPATVSSAHQTRSITDLPLYLGKQASLEQPCFTQDTSGAWHSYGVRIYDIISQGMNENEQVCAAVDLRSGRWCMGCKTRQDGGGLGFDAFAAEVGSRLGRSGKRETISGNECLSARRWWGC